MVMALAGTASAQPGATPAAAPAPAPAPATDAIDVMGHRWSVHAALWFGSVTPRVSGADKIALAGLDLEGRYRLIEPIELALSLHAGGGADPNGNDANSVSFGGFFVDARWRFMYDRPWNIAALAGLGFISASAQSMATDTEKQARGALRVGAALERRWTHWAIEADFRLMAVLKNDSVSTIDLPTQRTYQVSRYGLTGANLAFGGSYYF